MSTAVPLSRPTGLSRYSDIALAGLVVGVIVMMALPLPPWSLDVLVALNISLAVVLLLGAWREHRRDNRRDARLLAAFAAGGILVSLDAWLG